VHDLTLDVPAEQKPRPAPVPTPEPASAPVSDAPTPRPAQAQPAPTPKPTPTPTPTPKPTSTPKPTPTPTPKPTSTPTPKPTSTPKPTPSPEPARRPTPQPTPEPAARPAPSLPARPAPAPGPNAGAPGGAAKDDEAAVWLEELTLEAERTASATSSEILAQAAAEAEQNLEDDEVWDEEPAESPNGPRPARGSPPDRRVVVIDEDTDIPVSEPTGEGRKGEPQTGGARVGATLEDDGAHKKRWRLFRKGGE
jgi:hypothetical protein